MSGERRRRRLPHAAVSALRDAASREVASLCLRNVALGVRRSRREPGFAIAVVVTLALGTGAAGAVFSLVNAVLLRPLPWRSPESIGLVWATTPAGQRTWLSFAELQDLQRDTRALDGAAGLTDVRPLLTMDDTVREVQALAVSHNMFALLGVRPALGREFTADDDRPGAHPAVILSDAFWRTQYAADSAIVGRTLRLNDREYVVAGVLPESFELLPASSVLPEHADVWLPLEPHLASRERSVRFLHVIARVRGDATFAEASADVQSYGARATSQYAAAYPGGAWSFAIVPFKDDVLVRVRPALSLLAGLVTLVLVMACGNVANLLLARCEARRTELAVRAALGETTVRLAGGLLAEALLLATAGSVAGACLAATVPPALIAIDPGAMPRLTSTRVDGTVVMFMAAVGALTAVVFVAAPLVERLRARALTPLFAGRGAGRTPRAVRFGRCVVIAQTAFATAVVIATAVLVSSFLRLLDTSLGFVADGVASARVTLLPKYQDAPAWTRVFRDVTAAREGAVAFAAITQLPLSGAQLGSAFAVDASPQAPRIDADLRGITPAYFDVMRVALVAGRAFSDRDDNAAPPVAIVDEGFARRLSPDGNVLGRRIRWIRQPDRDIQIVGVARPVRHRGPDDSPRETVYRPFGQYPRSSMYVVTRGREDRSASAAALTAAVAAVDPRQPLADVASMTQRVERATSRMRTSVMLAGALAALALVLAVVGLYGVLSFAVARRMREFGVRLTLGARPADIRRLVLREGLTLAAGGACIGVLAAALAAAVADATRIGTPGDAIASYAGGAIVVFVASALAFWLPARRASRVEPIVTLRAE
jgi:putative ABC transport system permease protein